MMVADNGQERTFASRVDEVEQALLAHPEVQEAAVVSRSDLAGGHQLVAYLVAAPRQHHDEDPTEDAARVAQWQAIWEGASVSEPVADPAFDISGWVSSYTGMPLDELPARIWLDAAVAQIMTARPRRVLEIGCGTGLVLFRLAPHCERYVGVDFAPETLAHVRDTVAGGAPVAAEFELLQREARDLGDLPDASFDLVVINGVSMYFPGLDYLRDVLSSSLRLLEPNGAVFVGDVRHSGLLELFHTDVQLFRAGDDVPVSRLRTAVRQAMADEQQLLVHPAFFTTLPQADPRVTEVSVQPKRRGLHNEMTKYRYDVWLRTGPRDAAAALPWLDWDTEVATPDALRDLLSEPHTSSFGVRGIPNGWLTGDLATQRWLGQRQNSGSIADLTRDLSEVAAPGIDPHLVVEWADEAGLHCETSWASGRPDGLFDAVFVRDADVLRRVDWPQPPPCPDQPLANNPMQRTKSKRLVGSVREHLTRSLPPHLMPAGIVPLAALPKTPDGRIDRAALPNDVGIESSPADHAGPRSPLEETLFDILCEVLNRNSVSRGESFYVIGGDSLRALEVLDLVRQRLSVWLALPDFMACDTVADLLDLVERSTGAASPVGS
jgi:SAM-dependent methyltransferase/acyl carrier protein